MSTQLTDSQQQQPFRRPRLKRTVEPIDSPEGDILLMRVSAEDVRIPSPSDQERMLLQRLDGTRSVDELEQEFGASEVRDTLAQMASWSLLEDAAEDAEIPQAERDRLDRQLRYFSDVA